MADDVDSLRCNLDFAFEEAQTGAAKDVCTLHPTGEGRSGNNWISGV